jgi:hypothetical protein
MSEEIKNQTRRSAIKTAAQVAVTAPAVGLLLSAGTKSAAAAIHYGDDSHLTVTRNDDAPPSDDPTSYTITGVTGDDYYTY